MIYTRFHGRIGNQMFQYAAGRGLALRRNVELVIDDRLAIHKGEGSIRDLFDLPSAQPKKMPPSKHDRPLAYTLWRHFGRSPKYLRETGLGFNAPLLDSVDDSYLHGYWQSEKYFADAAEHIRADFQFPVATGRNADLSDQIANTLSVSLHVRRGDYVGNESHVICAQPYYDAALATLLPQLQGSPTIYVFSDEPDWARENLSLPGTPVFIDHNNETPQDDMRLMSLCHHNIIANSSFSWWGAWLNARQGRKVIAPSRWFGKPGLSNPDILPPDWQTVG
ncbi:MAG: alpha-1,2-fucosyltransferase [Aliishimia sp.]